MPADRPKRGTLFAVGGREARSGALAVLEHFVASCGGPDLRLVVLTAASRDPEKRTGEYGPAFRSLGIEDLTFFHQEQRSEASDPKLIAALERADAVFFTGGSQLKLVSTLAGTPAVDVLRERHRGGLHLGGTSAGASALSDVMIANGRGRTTARLSSVRMSPGFGLLSGVMVDQHFRERDRFGRLLAAVLTNPSLLGLGLDEDTAFWLDANDRLRVLGHGTLTVVDGNEIQATSVHEVPEAEPAAFAGMRLHVLTEGWVYDLAKRRVIERPAPPSRGEEPDPSIPRPPIVLGDPG